MITSQATFCVPFIANRHICNFNQTITFFRLSLDKHKVKTTYANLIYLTAMYLICVNHL